MQLSTTPHTNELLFFYDFTMTMVAKGVTDRPGGFSCDGPV
jgi:hypothetical protein